MKVMRIIAILVYIFIGLNGFSQIEVDSVALNKKLVELSNTPFIPQSEDIKIISKGTREGIQFRWAPINVKTWNMGIKHGYTLERFSSAQNTYVPVGKGVFKPWEQEQWMPYKDEEYKYMHIAAMAIFEEPDNSNQGFVRQSNELSNRHTFNLFAADMDGTAAEASGLSFLERDTTYFYPEKYRIFTYDPISGESSDTTNFIAAYYGPERYSPPTLDIIEGDGALTLRWTGGGSFLGGTDLTAYYIERAEDGKSFERLLAEPFFNPTTRLRKSNDFTTYIDSVGAGITYSYRVIGIDPFADLTEPSDTVSGMTVDLLSPNLPYELRTNVVDNAQVELTWSWDDRDMHGDLAGFNIYIAVDKDSPGNKINAELLNPASRSYTDDSPAIVGFNYYYVEAVDKSGNGSKSIATVGHIVDDVPPQPPTNLNAEIDSNGVILITWDKPADDDIQGYELFFTNSENTIFIKKPIPTIENEYYVDKTTLKTLTKEIFYKVVAMDYNFNRSDYSEAVVVFRPDIIPPAPALFLDYQVSEDGIKIDWLKSVSNDVVSVVLQRREANGEYIILNDFEQNSSTYLDRNVEEGILYEYNLITTDESNNSSTPEKTLVLEAHKSFFINSVTDVSVTKNEDNVEIEWNYDSLEDYRFIIYKKDRIGDLITFKKVEGENSISIPFSENETYSFAIKAKSSDGRKSKMSKTVMLQ